MDGVWLLPSKPLKGFNCNGLEISLLFAQVRHFTKVGELLPNRDKAISYKAGHELQMVSSD